MIDLISRYIFPRNTLVTTSRLGYLLWICLTLSVAPCLRASAAYTFDTASISHDRRLSFGFEFQTLRTVTVSALGYYDEGEDGLLTGHSIGIFDSNGVLLVSTFLASGAEAPLIDQFRYQSIDPLELPAGGVYTIAATTGGYPDGWAYGQGTAMPGYLVNPNIVVPDNGGLFLYQTDDILRQPSDRFRYTVYAGPNFLLAAPEPRTAIPAGCTLALWWVAYRRRRRS